jgi:NADPH2:quinone reductase
MRAVIYERTGAAAEVLRVAEVPTPTAGPGEVLVRVAASGINPADVKRRAGWGGMKMDHPLIIPHCDGAGTIEAVGEGSSPDRVGQRVWIWNAQGGYGQAGRAFGTAAEFIALPEAHAVPLPNHFTLEQGACMGVPAMTAHRCVLSDGSVAGKTVLVQGGAGSVGFLAVQIAIMEGARVFATVSGPDAAAYVRALGAVPINRYDENGVKRLTDLTDGDGFDRIVEVDFAANQMIDARLIKPNGTVASYSSSSDPNPILDYYAFASKGVNVRFIQGFALPEDARAQGQDWLSTHNIKIPVAANFSLDHCADAHIHVESAKAIGQTVITLG